ncbi:unnamed protein product [Sphagnum jensenii]|uniref:Uncharacterized protein n=1 Tax=Sphagnum jensenii TaxID=128206 RepID=A0ABP1AWZ8_9BRYO
MAKQYVGRRTQDAGRQGLNESSDESTTKVERTKVATMATLSLTMLQQRWRCSSQRCCCRNVAVSAALLLPRHCCYNVVVGTRYDTAAAMFLLERATTLLLQCCCWSVLQRYYCGVVAAMLLLERATALLLQHCCWSQPLINFVPGDGGVIKLPHRMHELHEDCTLPLILENGYGMGHMSHMFKGEVG